MTEVEVGSAQSECITSSKAEKRSKKSGVARKVAEKIFFDDISVGVPISQGKMSINAAKRALKRAHVDN